MGILTAILILGVLVFVHELGHFLVARYCGVGVLEFALGFGPTLVKWRRGPTTYAIRAIPLGGFVRMAGDDPVMVYGEEVMGSREDAGGSSPIEGVQEDLSPEQEAVLKDESRWFLKKPYSSRSAIVLAGPFANFLFAWVLAFGIYSTVGLPHVVDGPVTVGAVHKGLPAEQAGLKSGDQIITIDGKPIASFKELLDIVRGSSGRPLSFVVDRPLQEELAKAEDAEAGPFEKVTVTVKPSTDGTEIDVLEGRPVNQTFRIGITPRLKNVTYEKEGVVAAASAASSQVWGFCVQTLRVLKGLLTGLLSPTRTIGGPIEIIKQTAASADQGWMAIIGWMVFLNVTLGIMNLLPIPVLDGGHLTMFTIEALRGRPLSMKTQMAVTNVGMMILLTLMVFAFGNDLFRVLS